MFQQFKDAVQKQFRTMLDEDLFSTSVNKDELWAQYLLSFPEGTNPILKERTEYDCQCCRSFIKNAGRLVSIRNNKVVSIWDIDVGGHYQIVADAVSAFVKSAPISDIFLYDQSTVGVDVSRDMTNGQVQTWRHFCLDLPPKAVAPRKDIPTKLSTVRSTKDVFLRGLKEITKESLDTVLELIDQNSLYRGEENRYAVATFQEQKKEFDKTNDPNLFCWSTVNTLPSSVSKIRGTSIGTLLIDLSEGKDLDGAVRSFEAKVAPANYKRPTALISKAMILKAQEKIEELGYTPALERRFAVPEDITINNVLFANREAKKKMDVFEEMIQGVPQKTKTFDKVEEVNIQTFIESILPGCTSIEVLFENKHQSNLMSLVAPVDQDAKGLFKWPNNFSWAYANELADSMKQRVKKAGGTVDGDLRCSLSWFNTDDLDLHMIEPDGTHIQFSKKRSLRTGGTLDVDMNVNNLVRDAVENIIYPTFDNMTEGRYKLFVHNYTKRESIDIGFEVEVEFDGTIHSFGYQKMVANNENVTVLEFDYTRQHGIKFIKSLPSSQTSKQIWNVPTHQFQKVSMIMFSPNHWDDKAIGNKHYFFVMENCLNNAPARGFFNEFLVNELSEHRKVFEVLGSKMKTKLSDQQLSGLGFSSTQRNHLLCRVTGSFSRTIKLVF